MISTLAGLGECYAAAVPFFRYTVLGDMAFAMSLVGVWAIVRAAGARADPALFRP